MFRLHICLKGGKNLKNVELVGKQDPYCIVKRANTDEKFKTKVHQNAGANPIWNSHFDFMISNNNAVLEFAVWDQNTITSDRIIGNGTFKVTEARKFPVNMNNIQLVNLVDERGQSAGQVEIEVRWENPMGMRIKAVGAQALKDTETFTKQDPYLKLYFDQRDVKVTKVHNNGGTSAVWGEAWDFDNVPDPIGSSIYVEVWNKNTLADRIIGRGSVKTVTVQGHPQLTPYIESIPLKDNYNNKAGEVNLEISWWSSDVYDDQAAAGSPPKPVKPAAGDSTRLTTQGSVFAFAPPPTAVSVAALYGGSAAAAQAPQPAQAPPAYSQPAPAQAPPAYSQPPQPAPAQAPPAYAPAPVQAPPAYAPVQAPPAYPPVQAPPTYAQPPAQVPAGFAPSPFAPPALQQAPSFYGAPAPNPYVQQPAYAAPPAAYPGFAQPQFVQQAPYGQPQYPGQYPPQAGYPAQPGYPGYPPQQGYPPYR